MKELLFFSICSILVAFLWDVCRKFQPWDEPKVKQISALLPGLDCGKCGYLSCRDYAYSILDSTERIDKCLPGGSQTLSSLEAGARTCLLPVKKGPAAKPEEKAEAK